MAITFRSFSIINMSFVCEVADCGKILSSKSNLTRHIRSCHMKIKNYQCEICFKSLSSSQNLRKHMFLHRSDQEESKVIETGEICRDIEVPKLTDLLEQSKDPDLKPLLKIVKLYLCTNHVLNDQ